MSVKFTPDQWELLGRMYNAVAELKDRLEAKGFSVVCSLSVGIYNACLTFIVERNFVKILSFCTLDLIAEEKRVCAELFDKAEALVAVDYEAMERDILLKRLAELENKPVNGR